MSRRLADSKLTMRVIPLLLIAALAAPAPAVAATAANEKAQAKARKKSRAVEQPYGREGDARKVRRVVRIEMSDTMQFFPSELRVKRGDTVRFDLRNGGELPHQMVIGTMDELKKLAPVVKKDDEVEYLGVRGVQVAPGETGRLVWQFTRPGEFHYACLVDGHFDAGMIGTIVVR